MPTKLKKKKLDGKYAYYDLTEFKAKQFTLGFKPKENGCVFCCMFPKNGVERSGFFAHLSHHQVHNSF